MSDDPNQPSDADGRGSDDPRGGRQDPGGATTDGRRSDESRAGGRPQRRSNLRGQVSLVGGMIVIIALISAIVFRVDSDTFASSIDEMHPHATETGPSPVEGPPRRALEVDWVTECAWHDALEPAGEAPDVVDFYLGMDPDDVDELYDRSIQSNERLPGTYRLDPDGPAIPLREESVRFRGRSARGLPKLSFNIRLDEPLPTLSTDRLNFNAMYTDPAMVREHLSMLTFRTVGVPAPRTAYVNLYLDDVYEGLYVYMQRVDKQLLAEHGVDTADVTLVRDRSRDRSDDRAQNDEAVSIFDPVASTALDTESVEEMFDYRGEPDFAALASLIGWVRSAEPGDAFAEEVYNRVDVDELIDFLALHTVLGDSDAYLDDFWLYKPADSETFGFIPWDKDLTFGAHFAQGVANVEFSYESPVDRWVTGRNRLFDLVMTTPQLRKLHDKRVRELVDKFDVSARCAQLVELKPLITEEVATQPGPEAFVRHNANNVANGTDHDLHAAALLEYVQLRWEHLEQRLFADLDDSGDSRQRLEITAEDAGSTVFFTAANAWVVARLDIFEVDEPGTIEISVESDDTEQDVNARWIVDADDVRVHGQLSLYYRNGTSRGDWVQAEATDADPVAGQHDFVMVDTTADADQPLASAVNPYANRVVAEVELDDAHTFAIRQADTDGSAHEATRADASGQ